MLIALPEMLVVDRMFPIAVFPVPLVLMLTEPDMLIFPLIFVVLLIDPMLMTPELRLVPMFKLRVEILLPIFKVYCDF